jgi:heat-inducible transcriptional repressor
MRNKDEKLKKTELDERQRRILNALIQEYIHVGEPVGSRTLSKKSDIEFCSATLRNVMADLEEMGYLSQPHTSAGRAPTDKAFRFYVDSVVAARNLTKFEKERIRQKYEFTQVEMSVLMRETSQILSDISKQISVVVAPKFVANVFKLIEFINISRNRIIVIFVSQKGIVQNKLIEVEKPIPQGELDKYSQYLNDLLQGLTLQGVSKKIIEEMKDERNMYNYLYARALSLIKIALELDHESELYVEGKLNIFDYPEFAAVEKMKKILNALEEKEHLLKLLNKTMEARGVRIFIGSENELLEMDGCSIVTSTYSKDNTILGTLGVIGPTRMDYERIIPLVDFTAKILSEKLRSE